MKINIMSFNTQSCKNYLTGKLDYDIIADTIIKCNADIVGLQEIIEKDERPEYEGQVKKIAEKLGFYYYFAKAINTRENGTYGNALVSRFPILDAETVKIPDPNPKKYNGYYETRCLLKAKINVADGISVLVAHFGLNPDEQENAVNTVINNLEENRLVLMGDFNAQPNNPVLLPIKEKLYDTSDKFSCEKLSWPSDNPTVKIDYIFTSRDLKVYSADIPEIVSSDHRPHIATIEIN
ncbi:MAG: endonuclease/exonuclease/phosphatase family protein [Clostridia bacterium]|nr:endonuclease/exonuclease/phosphatase family protein [Clostridia bacterium]